MERKQDTRRKIQLGGLLIKAGLAGEEAAVLLGALLAVKDCLSGAEAINVRATWQSKGQAAFAQGRPETDAHRSAQTAYRLRARNEQGDGA